MPVPDELRLSLLEFIRLLELFVQRPKPAGADDEWHRLMRVAVVVLMCARELIAADAEPETWVHALTLSPPTPARDLNDAHDWAALESLAARLQHRRLMQHVPADPRKGRGMRL